MLLDEPTNHLDLAGIVWLERLLAGANFAFLLVSHDRYFLQNAARRVIELGRGYPKGYFSVDGTYADFLANARSSSPDKPNSKKSWPARCAVKSNGSSAAEGADHKIGRAHSTAPRS